MAKKTKSRRDTRPRLTEAQLQAYRTRQAATVTAARPAPEGEAQLTTNVTHWGRIDEEFRMIRADLVRLGLITAGMAIILVVLTIVLR